MKCRKDTGLVMNVFPLAMEVSVALIVTVMRKASRSAMRRGGN